MMLLRPSAAATREIGDPLHPHVRLPAWSAGSPADLGQVVGHLERGECVHVTLTIPNVGLLSPSRRGDAAAENGLRDLARAVGVDAGRVMMSIERQSGPMMRWWGTRAWRRGIGGAGQPHARERRLDELLAPPEPTTLSDTYVNETYASESGPCVGKPHVRAIAAAPLPWDVIDELHRYVSVGREAHLMLTLPRSPVLRDPDLHLLWERRTALDVADRVREVAQLWPEAPLVRIEVVIQDPTAYRGRLGRRWAHWMR